MQEARFYDRMNLVGILLSSAFCRARDKGFLGAITVAAVVALFLAECNIVGVYIIEMFIVFRRIVKVFNFIKSDT